MSSPASVTPAPPAVGLGRARTLRTLYLVRAAIAVAWALTLATAGRDSTALATGLLIFYPLLDVVASLVDARINAGTPAAATQRVNAALSAVTAIAMVFAATVDVPAMAIVFGVWAVLAGVIQLLLGIRRRRQMTGQWSMIVSGAGSAIAGVSFIVEASRGAFDVTNLAGYATVGAILFVISAVRLTSGARPTR